MSAGKQVKGSAAAEIDPMINRSALAELLGLTVQTLARWDSSGEGPVGIRIGKQTFYRVATVNAWLRDRERPKIEARAPKQGKAQRA